MHCAALVALLSFVAQAHAEDVAANDMNDSQTNMDQFADKLMEKLANKLVDRIGSSLLDNADLDTTTLGKPGHLGLPLESNLPLQISLGPEQEDDRALADYDDQREPMLDVVLSLQGGAAKSPMKSTGKAKKPMNEYMTKVQAARKSGAKSFEYKGKTYVQSKTKTGLVVYKAK